MKAKKIIRCVIFLILAAVLVGSLCKVFKFKDNGIYGRHVTYRALKANEIDAVYIGSSAVDRYWDCAQGFEEYGLTIYPFSSDKVPAWATKYMIEEALAWQDPSLVIIDVRSFESDVEKSDMVVSAPKLSAALPFYSLPKWKFLFKTQNIMYRDPEIDFDQIFDINYMLTICQFHSKWAEDDFKWSDYNDPPSDTLGFYLRKKSVRTLREKGVKKMNSFQMTDKTEKLDPFIEENLYELLDYLKNQSFEVLFIDSPHYMNDEKAGRLNTIANIVREEGFDFVQITSEDMGEYELDAETDFYDVRHVNYDGSVKYTRYLSEYLLGKYDFWRDHREDADTGDFDGVLDHIKEKRDKLDQIYNGDK